MLSAKVGRPTIGLSEESKSHCVDYVKASGFYKTRVAKFLRIDAKTLNKILKDDRSFSLDLEAADAEFQGKIIATARPEFILKTKYREEFPTNFKDDAGGALNEEIDRFLDRAKSLTNSRKDLIAPKA